MEENDIDNLIVEIFSRLTMAPEDGDFEIAVPLPECFLAISGGGRNPRFTLTPVMTDVNGRRSEGAPVTFVILQRGVQPDLFTWLRSNPWLALSM